MKMVAVAPIRIDTQYWLKQWGRWQRYLLTQGLGYPSRNSIHRMMEGQGTWIPATASVLQPDHPAVACVDQTIEKLEKNEPFLVTLLYQHYTQHKSMLSHAKAHGLTYYAYRKKWLAACKTVQQALAANHYLIESYSAKKETKQTKQTEQAQALTKVADHDGNGSDCPG